MATSVLPTLGEIIDIDTRMEKDWYEANFHKSKVNYFQEGIYGEFEVIHVKRYIEERHYKDHESGFPVSNNIENFEVFLKKVE